MKRNIISAIGEWIDNTVADWFKVQTEVRIAMYSPPLSPHFSPQLHQQLNGGYGTYDHQSAQAKLKRQQQKLQVEIERTIFNINSIIVSQAKYDDLFDYTDLVSITVTPDLLTITFNYKKYQA